MRLLHLALAFLLLSSTWADAASRFYVAGGTGNWNSTTNWSATSGGGSGASVPTVADDVFLDSSSGSGTLSLNVASSVKSFDCSGFTGTFTVSFNELTIGDASNTGGIIRFASGMTVASGGGDIVIGTNSGTHNLTTAGKTVPFSIFLTGGGHIVFKDDYTSSSDISFTTTGGNLDASDGGANHNITAGRIQIGGSATMGNGTWTVTGTGTGAWLSDAGSTITPGSSTIKFTNTSATARTFAGAGKTYNNFWHDPGTGTATLTLTGANTFNDFRDNTGTAAHTISFTSSITQTFTTFTVAGANAGSLITIRSVTAGTRATLSAPSGTITTSNVSIKDSNATGGATWVAGVTCTDAGNNLGWDFTACGGGPAASSHKILLLGAGK